MKLGSRARNVGVALPLLILGISFLGSMVATERVGAQIEEVDQTGFPVSAAIQGNRVNVRTGPSTNHVAITQLPDRTAVAATGRKGEWVRFSLPPSVPVWIAQGYVASNADGSVRVTGNSVRLRANPNTVHTAIGVVNLGTTLRPTGRLDTVDREHGPWVEIEAPAQASGWIHQDYIQLGRRLGAEEIARFYAGAPRAPRANDPIARTGADPAGTETPRPAAGRDPRGAGSPAVIPGVSPGVEPGGADPGLNRPEFRIPLAGREPLVAIYDKIRLEHEKSPLAWNFEPIVTELRGLARTSEDIVVADTAKKWIAIIEETWVPTQRRLAALEREKEDARRAREAAEAKEHEIEKRPGQGSNRREKEFLAVGWVATLGKYRKVDGTHRLLNGGRLVFYLKSEQLKLDDYVNKRVGITGVIQEQPPSAGAQLIHVTSIQVLSD